LVQKIGVRYTACLGLLASAKRIIEEEGVTLPLCRQPNV
jgi:hypothetical protein